MNSAESQSGANTSRKGKVILGVSGGVDSAVSAYLLQQQGYEVEALHMTNWDEDDSYCTAAADYQDARKACEHLGIPLHRVNFAQEYQERVFQDFLAEYRAGRTPNPDVLCNRYIKFGEFYQYAQRLGGDFIATGHYARVRHSAEGSQLLTGLDPNKDQSYFLHAIFQEPLQRTLFPLGDMPKPEVRKLANRIGLPNFAKRDSTGICFIGERPFREFLGRYLSDNTGAIETEDGQVIGEHQGLMHHTLGQRQGLQIGGVRGYPDEPWYVGGKDLERNVLIAVQGRDHPLLWSAALTTEKAHWISGNSPQITNLKVKTRYRQTAGDATVEYRPDGTVDVRFIEPQWSVTPGQYAVFYDGDVCLGGAVIAAAKSASAPAGTESPVNAA